MNRHALLLGAVVLLALSMTSYAGLGGEGISGTTDMMVQEVVGNEPQDSIKVVEPGMTSASMLGGWLTVGIIFGVIMLGGISAMLVLMLKILSERRHPLESAMHALERRYAHGDITRKEFLERKRHLHPGESALEALKELYAHGEITKEEYLERKHHLHPEQSPLDILKKRLAHGEITEKEFLDIKRHIHP